MGRVIHKCPGSRLLIDLVVVLSDLRLYVSDTWMRVSLGSVAEAMFVRFPGPKTPLRRRRTKGELMLQK